MAYHLTFNQNANSITYAPESDQSRIFVTSHSEFSSLGARAVVATRLFQIGLGEPREPM